MKKYTSLHMPVSKLKWKDRDCAFKNFSYVHPHSSSYPILILNQCEDLAQDGSQMKNDNANDLYKYIGI